MGLETDAVSDSIIEYGIKLQRTRKDQLPKFITAIGELKRVAGVMFEPSEPLLEEPEDEPPEAGPENPREAGPENPPEAGPENPPEPGRGRAAPRSSARKPAPNASDEPIASDGKLFVTCTILFVCNACCCFCLSQMKTKARARAKAKAKTRASASDQTVPIPNAPPSANDQTVPAITMTVPISLLR